MLYTERVSKGASFFSGLCLFVIAGFALPDPVFGERKPMLNLAEAAEGEGTKYIAAEEGQMFETMVLYRRRHQGAGDSSEIWLVDVPDTTVYAGGYTITRKVNIVVESEVAYDSIRADYLYSYVLHSLERSYTNANDFELAFDPGLPFSHFVAPQTRPNSWLAWAREKDTNPEHWERVGRPLRWFGVLRPGHRVEGFSFRSPVLPSVIHCWSSWFIPDVRSLFLGGKTLGPAVPPDPFEPRAFLKRLSFIVDESLSEGWIEDEGVAKDLRERLQAAQNAVERRDNEDLRSTLEGLLNKVENEKDHSLLSEVYGLLRHNVRYWLEQL